MIIVITGPTCVGKTKMSVELAKRLNGEVINADSTQVYKGMDIATAKVTEEEMEGIYHHLFNIKSIDEDYSIYEYQQDARKVIGNILNKGKIPILVGGTGLYIKAALYDYEFEEEIRYDYSMYSDEELYQKLKEVDPNTEIHPHNRKRIERALSYFSNHNIPMSSKSKSGKLLYDTIFIGLTIDRNILYDRINERVNDMVKNGLLEEAKKIYDTGIRSKAVMTPIGYKELFPYFDGTKDLPLCIEEIQKNSRHYAKRQYTFFNHQLPVVWVEVNYNRFENTVKEVFNIIQGRNLECKKWNGKS